jgi:hypothetical protein
MRQHTRQQCEAGLHEHETSTLLQHEYSYQELQKHEEDCEGLGRKKIKREELSHGRGVRVSSWKIISRFDCAIRQGGLLQSNCCWVRVPLQVTRNARLQDAPNV